MKKTSFIYLLLFTPLFFNTCEKEERPLPEVSTTEVTDITALTALSGGTIISDVGSTITARGVCWSTNPDPKITDSKTTDGTGAGSFTSELTGLTPATSYYFRAYATNKNGTGYGMAYSFTTLDGLGGIITTTEVTEITTVSAQSGGNISNDGGAPIITRGVVWNTLSDPTLNNNIGFTTDGDSTGIFISLLEGLEPGTEYFVRAYATNVVTTKYGSSISFTTLGQSPTATTLPATNITTTGANLNGTVNANYLNTIVTFEYGTTTAYGNTITATQSPVTDNIDANVNAETTDLTPGTTYYFRVKAENELGVAYGDNMQFNTMFIDSRDDNLYKTVKIGNQVWMAENLKYLPSVAGPNSGSDNIPYYYVYSYDGTDVAAAKSATNYKTYGVLYNWSAAMNGSSSSLANPSGIQGVCPLGWHLPSESEWNQLIEYLGGTNEAGGKLKETGTTHWNSPNNGATNESGFTALPGGFLNAFGVFENIGNHTYWWSSSETSTTDAFRFTIANYLVEITKLSDSKKNGFSIRCIKDE